ncbi:MAG: YqaJ-like viral recombinase domain protein [Candidatus Omnitrophica bacterium ADurb.Bin277]|nr:MAG: YqaJ-like viral recombinase domain protein [Candidatus Omnitrophica bacterium ADurb.Bin277]
MMEGPEWLEERRKGIGASDIAAIMGISPWKTPFQVYQEKRREVKDWEGSDATNWGKRMEPTIRQWYSDETGRAVRLPEKILVHPNYNFMFASLDGFTDDGRVVEIKTARSSKGWGEVGSNQIPDYYMVQVQHQMAVTGFKVADVPVSIGGSLPVLYVVPEDKELQEMIIESASEFWQRVLDGNPPPPVTYSDAVQRFGKSKASGSIIASEDVVSLVATLRTTREEIKSLEAKEEEIKGKLIIVMGDKGDEIIDFSGSPLVTYRLGKGRDSFDMKNFRKENADLYKKYVKEGEATRRFLVKGE